MKGGRMDEDSDRDRLRRALLAEGDEAALTQAVLTRLAVPQTGVLAAVLPAILPPGVALAGFGGLWLAVAVLGYQLAGGALGDPLLGFALGDLPVWGMLR